jgi:hypothetical protein
MAEHENVEEEAIRRRAHEISLGLDAGTPEDNWLRAEAELRRPSADEDAVRRDEEEAAHDMETTEFLQAHISSLTHP